jgi:hypothetical protein
LKRLESVGVSRAIQIIDYTISKGWQGLADDEQVPMKKPRHSDLDVIPPPQPQKPPPDVAAYVAKMMAQQNAS